MTDFDHATDRSQADAPYNGYAAYWQGYREYLKNERSELSGIDAQAYDRGAQLASTLLLEKLRQR